MHFVYCDLPTALALLSIGTAFAANVSASQDHLRGLTIGTPAKAEIGDLAWLDGARTGPRGAAGTPSKHLSTEGVRWATVGPLKDGQRKGFDIKLEVR